MTYSVPGNDINQEPDRHHPAQGQSRLGRDINTGKRVDVTQAALRQGLYITGIQGTGKSVLIENLIIQDIKQNMGVCLLDPHGDLTQAVLSRLPERREKDVIYLDINNYRYPFGVNLFQCPDLSNLAEVQKTIDQVVHVFEKLLGVSHETPLILEYLQNCTHTLIANPGYTMADIPLLLQDGACRKKLVAHVTDSDVQLFWRLHEQKKPADQSYDISSTLRRVRQFLQPLSRPIVGQSASSIDIRKVMDEGKILLVKLDTTLESITELIGSLIIALFLNAAKSRADLPVQKRRQFNLYADEFQRFATEDYATLIEEARKFGVGITIAHQNGSQLETSLKERARSVANLAVFKVNSIDADELAGEFDITPQEAWEEEIEPIRFERVEEQIADEIEEDIMVISRDPLYHLTSSRMEHVSEVVRNIIGPVLSPFASPLLSRGKLSYLLVNIMEGTIQIGSEEFKQTIKDVAEWGDDIIDSGDPYPYTNMPRTTVTVKVIEKVIEKILRKEDYLSVLSDLDKVLREIVNYNIVCQVNTGMPEAQVYDRQLGRWIVQIHKDGKFVTMPEIESKIERVQREIDSLPDNELERIYGDEIKKVLKEMKLRTGGREAMILCFKYMFAKNAHFLFNLITLCEELAKNPIRVPTGEKRLVPKMRTHLTYHTIPAKTIIHPQRTYADVHNEVASQLANLPIFTARVKIATDNGTEEHTIRTLDPKQDRDRPLFGQALQDRIDGIKKQNIQDGYVRERTTVEEEIRTRQGQCSQPPEAEPPISRHPPR